MPHTFKEQVREFLTSSRNPYSYNPLRNIYIWFGILWGLPIPLAGLMSQAFCTGIHDISALLGAMFTSPVQYLFFSMPLLFGCLFGILGTVRHQKEEEVNQLIRELKLISTIDPLTGLSNRRHFTRKFDEELARGERTSNPLALIFLDLDHFKRINDTHGHRMGDEILRLTGSHLRTTSRRYDVAARWGGEEFILLLPNTDEDTACLFAQRIRTSFAATISHSLSIDATVSIGVVSHRPGDTLETFIDRADKALYHAKATGRDRVVCWKMLLAESGGKCEEDQNGPSTSAPRRQ